MTSNIIPIPPRGSSSNNTRFTPTTMLPPPSATPQQNDSTTNGFNPRDRLQQDFQSRIEQENAMLDQLHASVTQTQHKALKINREIKDQDPMLGQLGDNIDHSNAEVQAQQRSVMDMLKDTKERSFWGTVAVLILIIIVLLWI